MARLTHCSNCSAGSTGSFHQANQVWSSDGAACSHGSRQNLEAQTCTLSVELETGTFAAIELDSEGLAADLTARTGTYSPIFANCYIVAVAAIIARYGDSDAR